MQVKEELRMGLIDPEDRQTTSATIDSILKERGERYGEFVDHAQITQELKFTMQKTAGWKRLTAAQKECLDMVAHKIGRILNGDPDYADSWVDIVGYTQLVIKTLPREN